MTDLYRDIRHFRFNTSGSQQRVLEKGEQRSPTQVIANMTNMNRIRIITGDKVDIPVSSGRHNKQDQAVMEVIMVSIGLNPGAINKAYFYKRCPGCHTLEIY